MASLKPTATCRTSWTTDCPTNINGVILTNFFNGEPEWIGVLQYPDYPHSATNRFIGRYAFLVLPIGKTLDFNYIHNYSKSVARLGLPGRCRLPGHGRGEDGFVRDQGVGPWELNLAGLLWGADTNIYTQPPARIYNYVPALLQT